MKNNLFCPKWIFDICVGVTAYEYIVKDIPIDLSAKKFVRGINLRYKEVQLIEITVYFAIYACKIPNFMTFQNNWTC